MYVEFGENPVLSFAPRFFIILRLSLLSFQNGFRLVFHIPLFFSLSLFPCTAFCSVTEQRVQHFGIMQPPISHFPVQLLSKVLRISRDGRLCSHTCTRHLEHSNNARFGIIGRNHGAGCGIRFEEPCSKMTRNNQSAAVGRVEKCGAEREQLSWTG